MLCLTGCGAWSRRQRFAAVLEREAAPWQNRCGMHAASMLFMYFSFQTVHCLSNDASCILSPMCMCALLAAAMDCAIEDVAATTHRQPSRCWPFCERSCQPTRAKLGLALLSRPMVWSSCSACFLAPLKKRTLEIVVQECTRESQVHSDMSLIFSFFSILLL